MQRQRNREVIKIPAFAAALEMPVTNVSIFEDGQNGFLIFKITVYFSSSSKIDLELSVDFRNGKAFPLVISEL